MRTIICSFLLLFGFAPAAAPPQSPGQVVSESVRSLAGLVGDCRLQLAADPVALRGVVDQHLRPKADVLYAGQLILGRHWPEADPDQRRRFAEALYGTLVRRYATGLLLLTDRNVAVVPGTDPPQDGEADVELRIQAGLATPSRSSCRCAGGAIAGGSMTRAGRASRTYSACGRRSRRRSGAAAWRS
jgi:phospholipid transport system substrate-binding protein